MTFFNNKIISSALAILNNKILLVSFVSVIITHSALAALNIQIENAVYGDDFLFDSYKQVIDKLQYCNGQEVCAINSVNNTWLGGDPKRGFRKALKISYFCINSEGKKTSRYYITIEEGGKGRLSCAADIPPATYICGNNSPEESIKKYVETTKYIWQKGNEIYQLVKPIYGLLNGQNINQGKEENNQQIDGNQSK